jgi:hypothetical protein
VERAVVAVDDAEEKAAAERGLPSSGGEPKPRSADGTFGSTSTIPPALGVRLVMGGGSARAGVAVM